MNLLEQYIEKVNANVWQQKISEMDVFIAQRVADLENEKNK